MGRYDDSIFGIDFNCDGKIDFEDDFLIEMVIEEERKRIWEEDEEDDDF